MREQGYSDIVEIEREDGQYCVEARNPEGKEVEIYVDATTGEVVEKDKEDTADLSKDEVIAKLKEQGYPEVSKIERAGEGDNCWVMASDADGKRFELHVNAKTGEITRKEQRGE
ncbi:MAG: PepSY domain-containing protein [Parvibaculaceae bacterium]